MRLPITKLGLPQVLIYPVLVLVIMVFLFLILKSKPVLISSEIILFLVFIWMLSFFRDPSRSIAFDEKTLFSPADGTITDITIVNDNELGSRALRIGIFLSVFNVHINRVPCDVQIESVTYKKGKFINAMSPESGRINESNDIIMQRKQEPKERILVRQVSGAIARRIVCEAGKDMEYRQGDIFGMIKFGSRTELYLPDNGNFDVNVAIGDKVRAGLTPLVRYRH
jgi:phosphatidylserine decarboxylase